jgi:outer membrane protein assembly factor BamB
VRFVAGAALAGHIAGPLTRRPTAAQAAPPVRWHLPVEPEASVFRPVADDGVVYFVSSPDLNPAGPPVCRVQCLDAATGAARWSRDLPENPACGPAFDGEVVVVATGVFVNDAFAVHALDGTTGETRWRQDQADFGGESATALGLAAFPGALYLHRHDGAVWSLDPATGEPHWVARPAGGFGVGEPVSTGELILTAGIASGVGAVGAVETVSGAPRWRVELPAGLNTTPAIVGDLATVGLQTATIVALEVATGVERWQVTPTTSVEENGSGDKLYVDRLAGADGTVFGTASGGDGSLALAWDAATSAERWRTGLGDGGATPPAVGSGAVYVRGGDDHLIALDAATGVERWRTPLPGQPLSSSLDEDRPPVVADGAVYVAAERMGLVAVDAAL